MYNLSIITRENGLMTTRENSIQWEEYLRDPALPKDTVTLGNTVRSVLDDIRTRDLTTIDLALEKIDVTTASPAHLCAVLSSLYTWRTVLPSWSILRDRALSHYRNIGIIGADTAFKGLF